MIWVALRRNRCDRTPTPSPCGQRLTDRRTGTPITRRGDPLNIRDVRPRLPFCVRRYMGFCREISQLIRTSALVDFSLQGVSNAPPPHHSFESLAGILILLPVTEYVRTPCSRNRTSFWGSGSKFSFSWSDVKKGFPKIYSPNMLYFIYWCGDDFVFPPVLYVFLNIVLGVWRVNLCRGRPLETLTSHRLRLEKELLPGWRPPQPVGARPGRPSENHNWHTGKPFPPPLNSKSDPYVSGNFTTSPLWLWCWRGHSPSDSVVVVETGRSDQLIWSSVKEVIQEEFDKCKMSGNAPFSSVLRFVREKLLL